MKRFVIIVLTLAVFSIVGFGIYKNMVPSLQFNRSLPIALVVSEYFKDMKALPQDKAELKSWIKSHQSNFDVRLFDRFEISPGVTNEEFLSERRGIILSIDGDFERAESINKSIRGRIGR